MRKSVPTATLEARKVDGLFRAIDQSAHPGVAVAIAIDGAPVYRKSFGLASLELPSALTPSMRMRIGSTTKHFTCLAYMLLCEEGRANVNDEIGLYIPELNRPTRNVTLRQLMGHTSGIRDIAAIISYFMGIASRVTDAQMVAYYRDIVDADHTPGTRWVYNNSSYVLLTIAIERIADQPLDMILRDRIFAPIGMHDTLLRRWNSDFVPNSATLHTLDRAGKFGRHYIGLEQSGAGGIVSTMDDMLRWLAHMNSPVVGSPATWAAMFKPQRLSNGVSTQYGLGLRFGKYRGVEIIHHSGGVLGGNSQMIKLPSVGLDISIAVNRSDIDARVLANQIIDLCVSGLYPTADQKLPELNGGTFISRRSGRVIELFARDGQLFMSVDGAAETPMSADESGALRPPVTLDYLQRSVVVHSSEIEFTEFGEIDVLYRTEQINVEASDDRLGVFHCEPIGLRLELFRTEEGIQLTTSGRHGCVTYHTKALTTTLWKASPIGPWPAASFFVAFDPDGQGIALTGEGMSKLRFVRSRG